MLMSAMSKVAITLFISLLLTSAAFAGNTSSSATLRLTVNVVPVVQVLHPVQDNAGAVTFGDNNVDFYLSQQQRSEASPERIRISLPIVSNVDDHGRAILATNANAVLVRNTYVAK
jgi:hypothetical protein